jgi:hypothetical protein
MIRQYRQITTAVAVLFVTVAAFAPSPGSAATRPITQTLVFDAVGTGSFVDRPPAGPSPGDTELFTARLRDSTAGHFVGTVRSTCVFTKVIPHDMLERCSATGRTSEGTLSFGGVGYLESMNPPWQVSGGTGAYKGAHGELVFDADIPVNPNAPLAAGRLFSVGVFELTTDHQLHVGVVPRPAANTTFIQQANAACDATERQAMTLPAIPFSSFDPLHPDPQVLPQVGRFFDQPARRRLPGVLLAELEKLGQPPASSAAWRNVLKARQAAVATETRQIKAALADDAPAFVRTVSQLANVYNSLVFTSAVFDVQSCTFS